MGVPLAKAFLHPWLVCFDVMVHCVLHFVVYVVSRVVFFFVVRLVTLVLVDVSLDALVKGRFEGGGIEVAVCNDVSALWFEKNVKGGMHRAHQC